ncbi:MAG: tetratricopeptide repeat protein [Deltaproteobacteria bacterium]|nr:tetratricopeptide repeat protein [Deltaproteobacteria bacterium]MBW2402643.1 tetratricopeptide repeat protein [Deltaproteobacteria bacterium]MBW2546975.1 tetratricopeptide repeat protein [Deltaproteobacteria bacterium]
MSTKYFCAHCDKEFVPEDAGDKPRCPQCMRRGGVEPVKEVAAEGGTSRPWLLIVALALVAAGIGYGVYRTTTVTLEDTPPLRPLEARELAAYLDRDQIRVGAYEPMMMLPNEVAGWPQGATEVAARMHGESSSWSLARPLPRAVLTVDQTFALMDSHEERVKLYPLELATAMTALLRKRGTKAMVAEVWEFEGARAPADPSGMLGYFVTAVYDGTDSEEPSGYFDTWGGRGEVTVSAVRVLRDTEVLAAAIGTEATRIFARSGDASKALRMAETALLLDPLSPSLRAVNATILVDSGGVGEAVKEFEAALQLRTDGPRQLNLVQLYLAQAGMLEMNGQKAAAEAQFSDANRVVGEVIEKWPRYGRAHVVLATIYMGVDEPERAGVELEAAEALNPDAPLLWAVWAQYYLAQSDPIAAAAKMNRAVNLDPDNWQLRLQAARVFQGVGDDDAAIENVDAALQLVSPDKRPEVRRFVERMMGPAALDLPDPSAPTSPQPASSDPALTLGDPSSLRLRDPGQTLQLHLDE